MTTINSLAANGTPPLSVRPQSQERRTEEAGETGRPAVQDRVESGTSQARSPDEVFAQLSAGQTAPGSADAARLLALDIRQQLQGQSAGIATVRPGSVLALLRNNA